jgi:hypothetical protein
VKRFEESRKKTENSEDVKKISNDKSSNWMYESSSSDVPNTSNTNPTNDASVQKPPESTSSETQPKKESKLLNAAEKVAGLSRSMDKWTLNIRKQRETVSKVSNEVRAFYENAPTPVQAVVNHTVRSHTYGTMNAERAIKLSEAAASSTVDVTARVVEQTGTIARGTSHYLRKAEGLNSTIKKGARRISDQMRPGALKSDVQWKEDQNNPYVQYGYAKPSRLK